MKKENIFFLVFILTILISRVLIYLLALFLNNPDNLGLTIFGFRIHHYIYGLILIIIGLIIRKLITFSIGLALFIDELAYLIIRGKTHLDNYSLASLSGTFILIILVFIFRFRIVDSIKLVKENAKT